MGSRLCGPGVRGIVLSFCFGLLAACGQETPQQGGAESDDGAGSNISAPLPGLLASSWADIKGAKEIDVVVDKGTDHERRYTLREGVEFTISADGASFEGKFRAKLSPGSHTFDLEYFVTQDGTRVQVATVAASPTEIVAGKQNRVDFSAAAINTQIDDDNDGATNLVEVKLETNPRSKESVPSFSVAGLQPANGATDVSVESNIVATFAKAVDAATVNAASFKVTVGGNGVSGAFTVSGDTVTFNPDQALPGLTLVSVNFTSGLRAATGEVLTAASFSFTTEQLTPPLSLAAADLPKPDALNPLKINRYIIGGLTAGDAYLIQVDQLTADVELRLYDDASFTTPKCASAQFGTVTESCVTTAGAGGEIFVAVDGTPAQSRADYRLTMTAINYVTGKLPFAGSIAVGDEQRFYLTGLPANTPMMIHLDQVIDLVDLGSAGMFKYAGDIDLRVYGDAFLNLACESSRGKRSDWYDQVANEGCVANTNARGELFMAVKGSQYVAENPSGPIKFNLQVAAPEITDISADLPIANRVAAHVVQYYVVTNVTAGAEYLFYFRPHAGAGVADYDDAVYYYTDGDFSEQHRVQCEPWHANYGVNCTVVAGAKGIFIAVDHVYASNLSYHDLSMSAWQSVDAAQMPYGFTPQGDETYLKVSGLDKNVLYYGMVVNDDPAVKPTAFENGSVSDIYTSSDLTTKRCRYSSDPGCTLGFSLISEQVLPDDSGLAYVVLSTSSAVNMPLSFTLAPHYGPGSPFSSYPVNISLPKGVHDIVYTTYNNSKVGFVLADMTDNVDFQVYYNSLKMPSCGSSSLSVAIDYCAVHEGSQVAGPFLLRVDTSKTASGADFSLDYWDFIRGLDGSRYLRAFGAVSGGSPTSDFAPTFNATLPASQGERYHFLEINSLHPGAVYGLRFTGATATTSDKLQAFTGGISASAPDCSVGPGEVCSVTSSNIGEVRLALVLDPSATSDLAYTLELIGDGITPAAAAVNATTLPVTVAQKTLTKKQSHYYRVTNLAASTAYDVTATWTRTPWNFDIYVYTDATFTTPAAGCAYALGNSSSATSETCAGAVSSASGDLYIRVYGNIISNSLDTAVYDLTIK